jgi:uncharacterized protein
MSQSPPANRFWEKPLTALDRGEWEALCDGCGQCCMHKVEDEDTGEIFATNIACRLLDLTTCQCSDYRRRKYFVPDCIQLTRRNVGNFDWLPETCAYRRRAENRPLPDWHYLISGDRDAVHAAGASVRGKAIAEAKAGAIEDHIIAVPLNP